MCTAALTYDFNQKVPINLNSDYQFCFGLPNAYINEMWKKHEFNMLLSTGDELPTYYDNKNITYNLVISLVDKINSQDRKNFNFNINAVSSVGPLGLIFIYIRSIESKSEKATSEYNDGLITVNIKRPAINDQVGYNAIFTFQSIIDTRYVIIADFVQNNTNTTNGQPNSLSKMLKFNESVQVYPQIFIISQFFDRSNRYWTNFIYCERTRI